MNCDFCQTALIRRNQKFCTECGRPILPSSSSSSLLSSSTASSSSISSMPRIVNNNNNNNNNRRHQIQEQQQLQCEFKSSWRTGPIDVGGIVLDISDRPLLCMATSANKNEVCIGGSDHGLKIMNLNNGKLVRELYTKKYGHTEWVTCCDYINDGSGRIISGGMDSKLCLWDAKRTKCIDLFGHTASISAVHSPPSSLTSMATTNIFASSSFDKTIRIWDSQNNKTIMILEGHMHPVLDFVYLSSDSIVSRDRNGKVLGWDIRSNRSNNIFSFNSNNTNGNNNNNNNNGPCTAMTTFDDFYIIFGNHEGTVSIVDIRYNDKSQSTAIKRAKLHPGGAITDISVHSSSKLIATSGADKRIKIIDGNGGRFKTNHILTDNTDFIYSMNFVASSPATAPLLCSGAGNGYLLVFDAAEGKCLYGLGAQKNAVRVISALENKLVAAGDDGDAIVYHFS